MSIATTKVTVTRTVCRMSYSFADVSVQVDAGADEAAIEAALLDVAGDHSYSEKDAEYLIEGKEPANDAAHLAKTLGTLLGSIAQAGFDADAPINGGDAVEAVAAAYNLAIEQLKGTDSEPYVIYSESEEGGWSNGGGWGDSPTHFFHKPQRLPTSDANDAKVIRLSEWQAIEAACASET